MAAWSWLGVRGSLLEGTEGAAAVVEAVKVWSGSGITLAGEALTGSEGSCQ